MTVSDILDIDSFEDDDWTNNDYDVPMIVDAQQVVAEVDSLVHTASVSGGESSSDSEGDDGDTEGDDMQEEDGEEDGDEDEGSTRCAFLSC